MRVGRALGVGRSGVGMVVCLCVERGALSISSTTHASFIIKYYYNIFVKIGSVRVRGVRTEPLSE